MHACGLICLLDIVFAVFILVTLPLYCVVLYVLVRERNRSLNSSFFTLCIGAGVADIWFSLHKYAFRQIPKWFFFEQAVNNKFLATVSKMGFWYMYFAQLLGVLMLTLNRFTSIVYPINHTSIWSPKALCIAIVMQWSLPLITYVPQFFPEFQSGFDNLTMYPKFSNQRIRQAAAILDLALEVGIFAPIFVVLYTIMIVVLCRTKSLVTRKRVKRYEPENDSGTVLNERPNNNKRNSTGTVTQQSAVTSSSRNGGRSELKLFSLAFTLTMLYLTKCVCYVVSFVTDDALVDGVSTRVYLYASDVFTGVSPYFLLAYSTAARDALCRHRCRRPPTQPPQLANNV